VLDVTPELRPERAALLDLLVQLSPEQWSRPTECPAYTVHGVALHVLGDDLSLLSRQRDSVPSGLIAVAERMPGATLPELLDAFNDGWVDTASFLSPALVVDLLRVAGDRTADFYETVDLDAPCEPVGFFGSRGEPSPYWQAIAREFVERWVHHSQIRRALGLGSLADERFVRTGLDVIAAAAGVPAGRDGDAWTLGPVRLGDDHRTADLLTRAHTADEVRGLVTGPADAVDVYSASSPACLPRMASPSADDVERTSCSSLRSSIEPIRYSSGSSSPSTRMLTIVPGPTASVSLASTTTTSRSICSSWRMRASFRPCSFFAAS
jgi:uncharacterized protein (TIGR03083 family)